MKRFIVTMTGLIIALLLLVIWNVTSGSVSVDGMQMYEIIADTAEQMGVGYIDLYQLTKGHSEWLPDGIHPNAEGNKAIADYIYECIEKQ